MRRVGYLAAVTVPAGTSEVTLAYHPTGLLLGVLISLLATLGSAGWLLYGRAGSRGRRELKCSVNKPRAI